MVLRRDRFQVELRTGSFSDRRHSGDDSLFDTAGSKLGHDRIADDSARNHVGKIAFQTLTHLNSQLPILESDEEQRSVIFDRVAQPINLGHLQSRALDRLAIERRHDNDLNLRPALRLNALEVLIEPPLDARRDRARPVDDPARPSRNFERISRGGRDCRR